jgi:putative transcriptional regulator
MKLWNPISIRRLRKKLGLTQEKFARKLGVSFPTVNRWENGHNVPNKFTSKMLDELARKER